MPTLSECFAGVVRKSCHAQVVHLEMIPQYVSVTDTNGVTTKSVTGFQRNLYVGTYETRSYLFEGVPASLALPASVTVADVDGGSHTVSLVPSVADGSTGTAVFEKDRNEVSVSRASPHMRTIEVTRTVGALYCNGALAIAAPSW